MIKYLTASILLCFFCNEISAQPPIILTDTTSLISIGLQADLLEDPAGKLSLAQILSPEYQSQFKRSTQDVPNYGIKQTTIWCRIRIKNFSDNDWVLNVDFPNLDSVVLFQPANNYYIREATGRSFPFSKRIIKNRSFIFPLSINKNEEKEFYLKVENHICVFPLYIGTMAAVSEKQYPEDTLYGIYYGISFIIIFYAIALYMATREKYYIYFFLQVVFFDLFSMVYCGEAARWFPGFALPVTNYGSVLISVGIIFVCLFFNAVLKTKKKIPLVSNIFLGAASIIAAGIIFYFMGFRTASPIINMMGMYGFFFTVVVLCFYFKHEKIIRLIFIGFCIGFVGIIVWALMEKNSIPYSHFVNNLFIIASIWWMIIFSIALELNVNNYIREKYKAQKELVLSMEKNEKLILHQNEILEQKVEERTRELKETQSQLIQREKMASLGELTAGIAHEIQNPLNFVNNFSEVNGELISELVDEVDKGNYDEVKVIAVSLKNNEEKINHHGKRADAIVKGMLQHSRTSTGKKELTDINRLADEYLMLAYHGICAKDKSFNAEIKTDFDYSIGKINIIPQDIGRVLLNLFNNAFYTTNEKLATHNSSLTTDYKPLVSVQTKKLNGKIEINVSDNGNGIPQSIVDKIFQPFFTTKPTGEGTGLGLSLSYDIIKAHGGEIKVETKDGEGCKFIIYLPV